MKAWYVETPSRPIIRSKEDFSKDHIERIPTHMSILYEVEILEETSRISDRSKICLTEEIWRSPEINERVGYGRSINGSLKGNTLFLPKTNIFYSRIEAIQEHQKRCREFILEASERWKAQAEVFLNYDDHLTDAKYTSPFTGEEK